MNTQTKFSKPKLKDLEHDEAEAEIEWILEAKAEGYTWKQLCRIYGVSIQTLKKFIKQTES